MTRKAKKKQGQPLASAPTSDRSALTCQACRRSSSIVATYQKGKMLDWAVSCSTILGGCGRWLEITDETAKRGGLV